MHPKTMFPAFPAFLLTAALAAAAAPQPVEIARSPNGRLHILQSKADDGYTLYTQLSGSLKEWTFTPHEPEIRWDGNTASVRISAGNYSSADEFTDGTRRYTAPNLVALHRPSGCYLGTDGEGRLAAAKLFDRENTVRRRIVLPDMAQTATPLSTLDYQGTRFLPDGSLKVVYTARSGKTRIKTFKQPCGR